MYLRERLFSLSNTTRGNIMISPKESQAFGLMVSAVTGLTVFTAVWGFFVWKLDFWYLDTVLGPVLGFLGGCLSAYAMFATGQRTTPLYWVGVGLFLGKPDETTYENGNHWVSPFGGIRNCPGKDQKFIIQMPGEKINAQDGIAVFFGVSEPAHPGKHNRLQYSVLDPMKYIAVDDPEDSLREEFIEKARLFFGQIAKAIGVKNVKLLFDEWIQFKSNAEARKGDFKTRLEKAEFVTAVPGETVVPDETVVPGETAVPGKGKLFIQDSVETIMNHAGEFMEKAETWGIGEITVFTPNVRINPEAEAAAAQKQAETEKMAGLETRVNKVTALAKKMRKEVEASPDLSITMVAAMGGQQGVTVENKTINFSGVPEVIGKLGEAFINKLKT